MGFFGRARRNSRVLHCREPKSTRKPPRSKVEYEWRDKLLFWMGFVDYRAYLKSDLWKDIRADKLAKHPNCELCGGVANTVHHLRYNRQTLLGKQPQNLASLCNECHLTTEFEYNGRKRTLEEARTYFLSRKNTRKQREAGKPTEARTAMELVGL